jgi:hypothetical protein
VYRNIQPQYTNPDPVPVPMQGEGSGEMGCRRRGRSLVHVYKPSGDSLHLAATQPSGRLEQQQRTDAEPTDVRTGVFMFGIYSYPASPATPQGNRHTGQKLAAAAAAVICEAK